ncbi:MAG: VOC family protein [Acidimicrobiales bacterium]
MESVGVTSPCEGVRTVSIPVTDQDRAIDFYVGSLGFTLVRDMPTPKWGPLHRAVTGWWFDSCHSRARSGVGGERAGAYPVPDL